MEDAYLIGIRLALDDGVSAGVAAIRQDLVALDAAVANSTANLRQLQAIAAQTVSASVGQVTRRAPTLTTPPASTVETQASPVAASTTSSTDVSANAANMPSFESGKPDAGPAAPLPPLQPASVAPPSINIATELIAPQVPTVPLATPRAVSPIAIDPQVPSSTPKVVAPRLAPPDRQSTVSPGPSPTPELILPKLSTVAPGSSIGTLPGPLNAAAESSKFAPTAVAPATPQARSPSQLAQPAAPTPQRSVAPQANSAASGPTSGDVFLDGAHLGRWMAANLAREASRPPPGGTSFDPRLGISWPGAQQSGE